MKIRPVAFEFWSCLKIDPDHQKSLCRTPLSISLHSEFTVLEWKSSPLAPEKENRQHTPLRHAQRQLEPSQRVCERGWALIIQRHCGSETHGERVTRVGWSKRWGAAPAYKKRKKKPLFAPSKLLLLALTTHYRSHALADINLLYIHYLFTQERT